MNQPLKIHEIEQILTDFESGKPLAPHHKKYAGVFYTLKKYAQRNIPIDTVKKNNLRKELLKSFDTLPRRNWFSEFYRYGFGSVLAFGFIGAILFSYYSSWFFGVKGVEDFDTNQIENLQIFLQKGLSDSASSSSIKSGESFEGISPDVSKPSNTPQRIKNQDTTIGISSVENTKNKMNFSDKKSFGVSSSLTGNSFEKSTPIFYGIGGFLVLLVSIFVYFFTKKWKQNK